MEAIDVEDGVYTAAYGPAGEPYHIGTNGDAVIITRTAEAEKPEELKALILRYFESVGTPADGSEDLAALIERCEPHYC